MNTLRTALALSLLPAAYAIADTTPLAHVEKTGNGPVALILVPGLSCDYHVWDDFTKRNADDYTMYAVTLPGMGETTPPPIDFNETTPWLDNAVDAIVQFVRTSDLDQPYVVGHSLGGFTAYRLGIEHGELFGGVVAVDGMPAFPISPTPIPIEQRQEVVNQFVKPMFEAQTAEEWVGQQDNYANAMSDAPDQQQKLRDMFRRTSPEHAQQYMIELMFSDVSAHMPDMKTRALAIGAVNDDAAAQGITAESMRTMWKQQIGEDGPTQLAFVEDSRHFVMDEHPEKFDALIHKFVHQNKEPAQTDTRAGNGRQAGKIKVSSLDDLPRHTYELNMSASELLENDEAFRALANAVRTDIENDLNRYDITDNATLIRLHGVLLSLDLYENRNADVLKRIETLRALESKEAKRLATGLSASAIANTRIELGDAVAITDEAFRARYRKHLKSQLDALPWETVADDIESNKGNAEILTENLRRGIVQSSIDPVLAQSGTCSADIAQALVGMKTTIDVQMKLRDIVVDVYGSAIAANAIEKKDIWAARDASIEATGGDPIIIAVWDSGVDTAIFKQQLWTNNAEKMDGIDNDGNGFIDDVHGIAHDVKANRVTEMLLPLDELKSTEEEAKRSLKGFTDVQSSVNSREASDIKKQLGELKPYEVKDFVEDLNLYAGYAHGTHVAGIAVAGNPNAQIMVSRLSFDHHMIPETPTVTQARKDASAMVDTVKYYKDNKVRVVNMSWGGSRADIENALESSGAEATAEERAALAREIYTIGRNALFNAIKDAPDILFICAAGNSDNDVEFDEMMPSGFDLPNLMVVGAVDQAGEPTSFTSFGKTVDVYASGFEVNSYIPGGERMKMSGTSMASPNAANLAGKLLALNPHQSPQQVIQHIIKTADPIPGDHPFRLINPKKAITTLPKN